MSTPLVTVQIPELHRKYLYNKITPNVFKITGVNNPNSGGTGFLLTHNGKTHIISNKHVCDAIGANGLVAVHTVIGQVNQPYIIDIAHDLCAIKAPKILGEGLTIGSEPKTEDDVFMVGHPHLEPIRLNVGHYMDNFKVCLMEKASLKTGKDSLQSIIDFFEAQRIVCRQAYRIGIEMFPGNSGSPILNKYGNVIAVAFAGSVLDKAAVPLPFLLNFLKTLK